MKRIHGVRLVDLILIQRFRLAGSESIIHKEATFDSCSRHASVSSRGRFLFRTRPNVMTAIFFFRRIDRCGCTLYCMLYQQSTSREQWNHSLSKLSISAECEIGRRLLKQPRKLKQSWWSRWRWLASLSSSSIVNQIGRPLPSIEP